MTQLANISAFETYLGKLETEELYNQVSDLALRFEEKCQLISQYVAHHDLENAQKEAHNLKSLSRYVSAEQLMQVCEAIESAKAEELANQLAHLTDVKAATLNDIHSQLEALKDE